MEEEPDVGFVPGLLRNVFAGVTAAGAALLRLGAGIPGNVGRGRRRRGIIVQGRRHGLAAGRRPAQGQEEIELRLLHLVRQLLPFPGDGLALLHSHHGPLLLLPVQLGLPIQQVRPGIVRGPRLDVAQEGVVVGTVRSVGPVAVVVAGVGGAAAAFTAIPVVDSAARLLLVLFMRICADTSGGAGGRRVDWSPGPIRRAGSLHRGPSSSPPPAAAATQRRPEGNVEGRAEGFICTRLRCHLLLLVFAAGEVQVLRRLGVHVLLVVVLHHGTSIAAILLLAVVPIFLKHVKVHLVVVVGRAGVGRRERRPRPPSRAGAQPAKGHPHVTTGCCCGAGTVGVGPRRQAGVDGLVRGGVGVPPVRGGAGIRVALHRCLRFVPEND